MEEPEIPFEVTRLTLALARLQVSYLIDLMAWRVTPNKNTLWSDKSFTAYTQLTLVGEFRPADNRPLLARKGTLLPRDPKLQGFVSRILSLWEMTGEIVVMSERSFRTLNKDTSIETALEALVAHARAHPYQ